MDTYIDDGTSGTTDLERRDFQRMVGDLERGRINCVMVKNLSRAFRNSANQGRFLEELIPLYNTRFISLYHRNVVPIVPGEPDVLPDPPDGLLRRRPGLSPLSDPPHGRILSITGEWTGRFCAFAPFL